MVWLQNIKEKEKAVKAAKGKRKNASKEMAESQQNFQQKWRKPENSGVKPIMCWEKTNLLSRKIIIKDDNKNFDG